MVAITQTTSAPVAPTTSSPSQPRSAPSTTTPAAAPTSTTVDSPPSAQRQPSEQRVKQAVELGNNALINNKNESISFGYEKRLGLLFVQVTDRNTGEVLREIPSKDFIRHAIAMKESIGLILDKKG
ncbi:MAG: flagellar protein FlaG [Mariprofundales bacterium]|nr:flagellar protein FlaG [Mariprofundales bacterium]